MYEQKRYFFKFFSYIQKVTSGK